MEAAGQKDRHTFFPPDTHRHDTMAHTHHAHTVFPFISSDSDPFGCNYQHRKIRPICPRRPRDGRPAPQIRSAGSAPQASRSDRPVRFKPSLGVSGMGISEPFLTWEALSPTSPI